MVAPKHRTPFTIETAHLGAYRAKDTIPGIHDLWNVKTVASDVPLVYYITVTPDLASHWLHKAAGTHNRKLKWPVAQKYARDMRAGQWQLTCQGIEFDPEGTLLNGQHRLHAVVIADMPMTFLVGFNVKPEAQKAMDIGALRTLFDAFTLAGVRDASVVATVVRVLVMCEKAGTLAAYHDYRYNPTRAECWAYFEAHQDVQDVATLARALRICLPTSVAGVLVYLTRKNHPVESEKFWRALATGVGLGGNDIRHLLRERLIRNRQDNHNKMVELDVMACTIKGWNGYLSGGKGTARGLSWRRAGVSPEPFPELL